MINWHRRNNRRCQFLFMHKLMNSSFHQAMPRAVVKQCSPVHGRKAELHILFGIQPRQQQPIRRDTGNKANGMRFRHLMKAGDIGFILNHFQL